LLVLGDPGNHVVITSNCDDAVMGDTNGDGNTTSAATGDWASIGASSGGAAFPEPGPGTRLPPVPRL